MKKEAVTAYYAARLEAALHSRQCHPDYRYSMTYEDSDAHTSRVGWERNHHVVGGSRPFVGREVYWMQRRTDEPKP